MSALSDIDAAYQRAQSQVGQEIGVSNWIKVDQPMIDRFAQVTHDEQWIHVDPARAAAETPFGTTIAHGFLTLSLASRFIYDVIDMAPGQTMGINYGFDRLRFLSPVRCGSRLRGRFVMVNARKRSGTELLRTLELTIEIEHTDTPALVAEWLGLAVFSATD